MEVEEYMLMYSNYYSLKPIDMYNLIKEGEIAKFPKFRLDKYDYKEILRHVAFTQCNFNHNEIAQKITHRFLNENHMSCFIKIFNNNLYELINFSFPEYNFKPWELAKVSHGFWENENNRVDFVLWICEKESLDIFKKEDIKKITATLVTKYGGGKALAYAGGIYGLLKPLVGNSIQEWELTKVNKWSEEKAIRAIKWLIEKQLMWNDEMIYNHLTANIFRKYDLDGMLYHICHHSPYEAIQLAYPGRFKELKNKFGCSKT